MRLCFICQTNGEQPTTFYLDDLRLTVCTTEDLPAQRAKPRSAPSKSLALAPQRDQPAVYNIAAIYSAQTGWVYSNGVLNTPFRVALPMIVKP